MTDDTVYVVPRGNGNAGTNRVHLDEDCQYLERSVEYHEKPVEAAGWLLDEVCTVCAGTDDTYTPPKGENTNETRRALLDLNPEDAGLSPVQANRYRKYKRGGP